MLACRLGHLDVVNRLAELGAEVDHAKQDGSTGLMLACQNGHLYVVNRPLAQHSDGERAVRAG